MRRREIREMDVAVRSREKKSLTEVCSVHLRVTTIAPVFRACCDFARRKIITGVLF